MAGANRGEEAVVAAVPGGRVVGYVAATGAVSAKRVEGEAVRVLATALGAIGRVAGVVTVSAGSTALTNVVKATVNSCDEIWIQFVQELFHRFQKLKGHFETYMRALGSCRKLTCFFCE